MASYIPKGHSPTFHGYCSNSACLRAFWSKHKKWGKAADLSVLIDNWQPLEQKPLDLYPLAICDSTDKEDGAKPRGNGKSCELTARVDVEAEEAGEKDEEQTVPIGAKPRHKYVLSPNPNILVAKAKKHAAEPVATPEAGDDDWGFEWPDDKAEELPDGSSPQPETAVADTLEDTDEAAGRKKPKQKKRGKSASQRPKAKKEPKPPQAAVINVEEEDQGWDQPPGKKRRKSKSRPAKRQ